MASFDTWAELRLDILDRAEEETGANASEFYDFVARAGDRAYQDLCNRRPWLFTRAPRPLFLKLEAPINAAVASWATDSYTLTLTATQSKNLTGWRALVAGEQQAIPIYAHVPGTAALTMAAPRLGNSVAASTAVVLFKIEYDLAELQDVPALHTVALAGSAGNVDNGAHGYRVTFRNAHGETPGGPAASVTVVDKTTDGQVSVTAIPTGPPGTLTRRLWRTAGGGTSYRLLAEIADNTTTTYTDNVADTNLGTARIPETNTTGTVRHIVGMWCGDANRQIEGPWSEERIRETYPDAPSPAWPPAAYARITETLIRFSQYPSQAGIAEIAYSFVPRDLSGTTEHHEIVLPRNWRWMLSDGGLFFLLDIKHDNRAATWGARWEKALDDLKAEDDNKRLGIEGTRDRTRKEPAWR